MTGIALVSDPVARAPAPYSVLLGAGEFTTEVGREFSISSPLYTPLPKCGFSLFVSRSD